MARSVLVAGGAGFIGSQVCKRLAAAGMVPVAYDTLEKGHDWAVRWGPMERGDIGDEARLTEVFARHKPDAVIHLAGYIEVGESMREPERYWHNNTVKTKTLIQFAETHGVEHFVFSSTCAVYGAPRTPRLAEGHPFNPASVYGETKLAVEELLRAPERRLRSIALRYFNAAGADPDGDVGEAHDPESHLMPLAIDAMLGTGRPLTVYGGDYDTPDGTGVRDFVHVDDLADAHVRALGYLAKGGTATALNVGSGQGYSVRQLIDATGRLAGSKVPHSIGPRRAGDVAKLVCDTTLIERELGWSPTHGLEAQIEHALRWRRKMPRQAQS
ncbi:UDP-glucose 4-epimerase GalE [Reyranella sp. CPCC 100927]|uniref:UDP-glucose 4-epimerase GalE n=1 Tax=Reyranella sp. CPCC 100927 TaxID=2599616 RepID=UPI0011B5528E|nr:UDP-glucose 4-epimerase GalE [Reyranella sp. CPCC 100927]TWT05755.1 UDP-glucose 4-epimerase GalE [Reyranella sp. CPCC 100927]